MSFTITGQATDLDLDVASLPTVTAQVLAPWTAEDGTLRTSHAAGRFDEAGALTKDDGGAWVIGAPEGASMYLKASGLPSLRFTAPADGVSVDLADLYAANSPLPAPSPTTSYVRGASAYEVAVVEGFAGTEAEWLASLQGDVQAHASRHAAGGSDPISAASIGAVASDDVRLYASGSINVGALLLNSWTFVSLPPLLERNGNIVTLHVQYRLSGADATADTVMVIPAGFRPKASTQPTPVGILRHGNAQSSRDTVWAFLLPDGSLQLPTRSILHDGTLLWTTSDAKPATLPGPPA